MKISRTKNATRNIQFGVILKIYQMLVPFAIRTAMINLMGLEYVGLNSLFSSIIQILNIAELGVNSAMVYSMYKPIAEDDKESICALMRLYRFYYRIIGAVILIIGLILLPFIPNLISGTYPAELNIYVLYLLNLFVTVMSYWLFAYKNSILIAHQRTDIGSKVTIITSTLQYGLQLLVLWLFKNYYLYLIVALMTQILTNIANAIVANKLYPEFKPRGRVSAEIKRVINGRIKDLFTSKIGSKIVTSADSVVISAFLGLTPLALYNNYYNIMSSIMSIVTVIFQSILAGIGNSIITESEEKNLKDFKMFNFMLFWLNGFCSICLLCLYQPFMKIWIGEDGLLPFGCVICFCLYFFVQEQNQLLIVYKDAGGIWHSDRFRPFVTAFTNLALNLLTVKYWGIYGVVLSTVIATLIVGMPWLIRNVFSSIFKTSSFDFIRDMLIYTVVVILAGVITYFLCSLIASDTILGFIYKIIICCIVPNLIFLIIFCKNKSFELLLNWLKIHFSYQNKIFEHIINFLLRLNKCK